MNENAKSILVNKNEMYKLYISEGNTLKEIAKMLNVNVWSVREYMNKKHGIYKTIIKPDPKKHITEQYLRNKKWLREEYLVKRKTARQIASELSVPYGRVDRWIKNHGFYGQKTYKNMCNESKFCYNDPIFCYYSGYIAADGHIDSGTTPRVSLRSNDKCSEILFARLINHFEFTGDIRLYKNSYDLTITSQKLVEILFTYFNITPAKTKTLKFPNHFYNDICASMYFRGVIDGDGNIRKDGGVRLYCGSHEFINGCISFINTRFSWKVKKTFVRGTYPGFSLGKSKGKELLDWIYTYDRSYLLERKYNRYLSIFGHNSV